MIGRLAFALPALLVASCGDEPVPQARGPRDPQVAQALNDPLMTDPDLSSGNEAAAALTVESDFSQPVLPATPEEIAHARAEAALLAGGIDRLPPPGKPAGVTTTQFAAFVSPACARTATRSAIWAARLPAAMPIYPRGHTIAAAGSDAPGCRHRIVTFVTAVPLADVLALYLRRAGQAGLPATYAEAGAEWAVIGGGAPLRYDIRGRTEGDHTVVRLATLQP